MTDRNQVKAAGFGRSNPFTYSIAVGATGSNLAPVNFGRNVAYVVIKCDDTSGIPAACSLSAQVAYDDTDTLDTLYERDDPSTAWSKGSLPTSGSLAFVLVHALHVQRIRLILSGNATGTVTFTLFGAVQGVERQG